MAIQLGDAAPLARTRRPSGSLGLHEYLGDSRGLARVRAVRSQSADFTPVGTTAPGVPARRKDDSGKCDAELIGASVDPMDSHRHRFDDIAETQGTRSTIYSSAAETTPSRTSRGSTTPVRS
jgi:alkyl hydroperoxide reductase subunit AhpC